MTRFLTKIAPLSATAIAVTLSMSAPLFAQDAPRDRPAARDMARDDNADDFDRPAPPPRRERNRRAGNEDERGPARRPLRGGPRPAPETRDDAGRGGQIGGDLLQRIAPDLELTRTQKDQIRPIAEIARQQIDALPADNTATTDRGSQVAAIITSARTKIRPILTPEQRTQLDAADTKQTARDDNFDARPRPRRGGADALDERDGPPRRGRGEMGGRGPRPNGPRDERGGRGRGDDERDGPPPRREMGGRGPRGGGRSEGSFDRRDDERRRDNADNRPADRPRPPRRDDAPPPMDDDE